MNIRALFCKLGFHMYYAGDIFDEKNELIHGVEFICPHCAATLIYKKEEMVDKKKALSVVPINKKDINK